MKKRKRFKVLLSVFAFCCFALFMFDMNKASAASMRSLSDKKTYSYDLNQDGKKEKIKISQKFIDENKGSYFTVYVNGKKAFATRTHAFWYNVKITDLNKKDKAMDLVVTGNVDSDCLNNMMVLRYKNGTFKRAAKMGTDIKLGKYINIFRISNTITTSSKTNMFYINVDTMGCVSSFGCFYAKVPVKIVKGKLVPQKQSTYQLTCSTAKSTYQNCRSMTLYKSSATNSKIIATLKKNSKFKATQIKIMDASHVMVKVKTSKGKVGWLYFGNYNYDNPVLKNTPVWG